MNKNKDMNHLIACIINYSIDKGLIDRMDSAYVANQIYNYIGIEAEAVYLDNMSHDQNIYDLLEALYVLVCKDIDDKLAFEKDNFFADIMNIMLDKPSTLNQQFWHLYRIGSPQKSTDYFYNYSQNSTYIRMDRIKKNIKWETKTEYGKLEITINLSKPEKDPKAIALAKKQKANHFPKCLLCKEHVGHMGKVNMPSRQNHRTIQCPMNNDIWHLQYSPYVYYNEHAIILCQDHREMILDRKTLVNIFDFVDLFPHYFIGSNADLPIVGGSILSHDHYQGGRYEFPIMNAEVVYKELFDNEIELEVLKWPVSVIRLKSTNREALIDFGDHIMESWKNYDDVASEILSHSMIKKEKIRHNTVTPILRQKNGTYELYFALRNNRCNDEYPAGIFHPHSEHHHIKKENIGLIEVMGLAILPGRLKQEMAVALDYLNHETVSEEGLVVIEKHIKWLDEIRTNNENNKISKEKLEQLIGMKFMFVLENAGVYKQTEKGLDGFKQFIKTL